MKLYVVGSGIDICLPYIIQVISEKEDRIATSKMKIYFDTGTLFISCFYCHFERNGIKPSE